MIGRGLKKNIEKTEEIYKHVKSKKRVSDYGEVFTAQKEVNAMLYLVEDETERMKATFGEPACGAGDFLIEILRRKVEIVRKQTKHNYTLSYAIQCKP